MCSPRKYIHPLPTEGIFKNAYTPQILVFFKVLVFETPTPLEFPIPSLEGREGSMDVLLSYTILF